MITDTTIKTVLLELGIHDYAKEDKGYRLKYKSNPTIIEDNCDAFRLESVSKFEKTSGIVYVDRVLISNTINESDLKDILIAMHTSCFNHKKMKGLDFVVYGFQRPSLPGVYLREIENNHGKYELRFYAKGYPLE